MQGVYRIQREVLHLKDTFEFNVLLALPYFVVLVLVLLGINVFVVLLIGSIAAIIKIDRRLQRRQIWSIGKKLAQDRGSLFRFILVGLIVI